ncbi:MAG TPA: hypothetical protein PLQ64_07095 [Thiobacillaceae bacterium]|nr:hypothetical protein [Thiobacillaceae bacterium]HNA82218.1 hypothetical protein [Thiobacillaceae bacterium]HNG03289.1 hypothetical protein [Nitrospira sp.]HNI07598.1 hypothetical protein [Thiobacillaceae bacterium]
MLHQIEILSVWEIGHRWVGYDPDKTDSADLPLPVKDAFRQLIQAIRHDRLPVCNEVGIQGKTYIFSRSTGRSRTLEEVLGALEDNYFVRRYERELLDSIYLAQWDVGTWASDEGIPLPDFWFPPDWVEKRFNPEPDAGGMRGEIDDADQPENAPALKASQADKLVCQGIARALWDIDPVMTIADMCKHKAIQQYGNGRHYKGKDTLRNWLSEVAPATVKGRRGRPRAPKGQ